MNVTLAGTPEYSLAASPAPRVGVIGTTTVTPVAGASSSVTVTADEPPSVIDAVAAPNETATPTLGVTLTSSSAPSPATFSARTS